jgi:hypothetical protein
MTRGTRVTRATLAVLTTQASRLAATGTPSLDNKTSASSDDNNSNIPCYLVDFLNKRMLVVRSLALAETREVVSFFSDGLCNYEDAHQMDRVLVLELDV